MNFDYFSNDVNIIIDELCECPLCGSMNLEDVDYNEDTLDPSLLYGHSQSTTHGVYCNDCNSEFSI